VLVSVGTSALVWPAAEIPHIAIRAGCPVIIVNPDMEGQPRGRTVVHVQSTAAAALPRMIEPS